MRRRDFLKLATKSAAGLAVAPFIIPSSAFGRIGPSNRLTMGIIGVGSQGSSHLKTLVNDVHVQIVAVCDVDGERRDKAKELVEATYASRAPSGSYKGCAALSDFRELLARPDIDAVLIAVPDHWHALPVIYAARAGKDIYAEKPLSLTIPEGQAMVRAVEESGVVCQIGSQQRSSPEFQRCVELARNGFLGKLTRVTVGLPPGAGPVSTEPLSPQAVPPTFDYDMWLGPAQPAPYFKQRCHWDFRWIYDYSGGQLTDWIGHHFDIGVWGAGVSHTGPIAIKNASAEFAKGPLYNTAMRYSFEAHYANGLVVDVSSKNRDGVEFIGTEGSCWAARGKSDFSSPLLRTVPIPSTGWRIPDRTTSHRQNFFDCIVSRQTPRCPIQEAHRVVSVAHLANLAFRTGRSELQWDPDQQKVVNAPEVEQLMTRAYRGPWQLPC
ncbi:MAG TPA: Gfo/Idh/MocA family oxidoreductase [Opitutaceae bacterium]|nr:Gfo/Idh/MocA family oxidoreductase [Opitutaceae bacterium]